jgi:hypothetical protein
VPGSDQTGKHGPPYPEIHPYEMPGMVGTLGISNEIGVPLCSQLGFRPELLPAPAPHGLSINPDFSLLEPVTLRDLSNAGRVSIVLTRRFQPQRIPNRLHPELILFKEWLEQRLPGIAGTPKFLLFPCSWPQFGR